MIASLNQKSLALNATSSDTIVQIYIQQPERYKSQATYYKKFKKKNRNYSTNNDQYTLINDTPNQRSQKQLREVVHALAIQTIRLPIPTNIRPHAYCYEKKKRRRKKFPLFLPLRSILSKVFSKPRKSKYKARRKFYNCTKKCYEDNPEYHLAYLMQEYNIAYDGDIFPAIQRLAEELQVSKRIIDRTLKNLKSAEDLYVQSGKKNWTTNQYSVPIKYQKTPLIAPPDYIRPKILHWILSRKFSKAKCPKLKRWIGKHFRRQKKQFAHYSFQEVKNLRTSIENVIKNSFKTSKDPPKKRKRPILGHLLKEFSFSFKDQAILSCYGESVLRAAIDDLRAYEAWGKVIYNKAALLVSRCKVRKEKFKAKEKAAAPEDIKNWIVNYLKSLSGKLNFISSKDELDLATSEVKPFIDLKFHKEEFKKSVLKVFQKVNGTWIDKIFYFDRPDLVEAIESYLENSLKTA